MCVWHTVAKGKCSACRSNSPEFPEAGVAGEKTVTEESGRGAMPEKRKHNANRGLFGFGWEVWRPPSCQMLPLVGKMAICRRKTAPFHGAFRSKAFCEGTIVCHRNGPYLYTGVPNQGKNLCFETFRAAIVRMLCAKMRASDRGSGGLQVVPETKPLIQRPPGCSSTHPETSIAFDEANEDD